MNTMNTMNTLLDLTAVAAGGSLGAVARYAITLGLSSPAATRGLGTLGMALSGGTAVGTTIANLLGCFVLGMTVQTATAIAGGMAGGALTGWLSPRVLLALRVGILGSLTTFSTLIGESAGLAGGGRWPIAAGLIALNLIAGWLLFLAGETLVGGGNG